MSPWMDALPLANTAAAEVVVALFSGWRVWNTEPVLLNVCGAPELIPRNEFRQHM
jgi:hypothetical protein